MGQIINNSEEPDGSDHILIGDSAWVTVGDISVYIHRCDEGVSVTLYPHLDEMRESLGETWALFSETEQDEPLDELEQARYDAGFGRDEWECRP